MLSRLFPIEFVLRCCDLFIPSGFSTRASIPVPSSPTQVFTFTDSGARDFKSAIDLRSCTKSLGSFSLLTTVLNEADTIESFLDSISKQSCIPREVIICDGGSSDETLERIERWKSHNNFSFSLQVIESPGANIAEGRNLAARAANTRKLVFADVGTILHPEWCYRMVKPLENDCDVSIGWYEVASDDYLSEKISFYLHPSKYKLNPDTVLPSGRSLAMTRETFIVLGGFPETLSFAAEDSLFGFQMRWSKRKIAFVPDAVAQWRMPRSRVALWNKLFLYARGDGESGFLFWSHYVRLLRYTLAIFLMTLLLVLCGVLLPFTSFLAIGLAGVFAYFLACIVLLWRKYVSAYPRSGSLKIVDACAISFLSTAQIAGFLSGVMRCKEREDLRRMIDRIPPEYRK